MNNTFRIELVAALLCGIVVARAGALTVTTVSQVTRPSSSTYGAEQISGITYAGGDLFYAVDDNDNKLYPLTLAINRANGSLTTAGITIGTGVVMSGGSDMEGCAFDPCSGKVWISQETSALIREYDPSDGTLLRSAPIPAVQKKYRGNYSLEALTISGDGRTMWTANEEALTVDGELATNSVGSVVRLTRFTRAAVHDNWTPNGEWAYVTQPIGTAKDSHTRSGVSGLCALPDDTLLVLERRCYQGGLFPDFNIQIYQVNFSGATDVSAIASLKDATYTPTTKTSLWSYTHSSNMPNYEGICLGPRLDDGSSTLVLVGDAGSSAEEGIFVLKVAGLSIRTFEFEAPSAGTSSIVGKPYRFVDGATVNVALEGVQTPSTAYTNNNTICRDVGWKVVGTSPISGTGPLASFTVSADGAFSWETLSEFVAHTPIVGGDTFEEYAAGACLENGDVAGWTGEGSIKNGRPTQADADCSMPLAEHAKMLSIDEEATRSYGTNATNANQTLDMMLSIRRSGEDELPVPEETCQTAIAADKDGYLNVYTTNGWTRLSGKVYDTGDWVRLTIALDYATRKAAVRVDGTSCGTYDVVDRQATGVSELYVGGSCSVDDVYLRVSDTPAVAITPKSEVAVASASEVEGLRVTASSDAAAQAMLSADAAKMARFSALFRPVLDTSSMMVSFEMTDEAKANETNKIGSALISVDLAAVAAGTPVAATIADTTPGLYYSLKAGPTLDGMTVDQCVLGDGTDKVFTFEKQESTGFYTIEVTLEPRRAAP